MIRYKRQENQLIIFADDTHPRWITCTTILDYDTVATADKFGNIAIVNTDFFCNMRCSNLFFVKQVFLKFRFGCHQLSLTTWMKILPEIKHYGTEGFLMEHLKKLMFLPISMWAKPVCLFKKLLLFPVAPSPSSTQHYLDLWGFWFHLRREKTTISFSIWKCT